MIVLLDTHVVIWLTTSDDAIGRKTRALVDAAGQSGTLAVSAISFWEIALLIEKGRLDSPFRAEELRTRLLRSGMSEIPLTGDIALISTQLSLHGDPADRFIAASALAQGATLVTADERLLGWKHATKRQDARK